MRRLHLAQTTQFDIQSDPRFDRAVVAVELSSNSKNES